MCLSYLCNSILKVNLVFCTYSLSYLFTQISKMDADKGIVYSNRVRLGNWYEAATLEEVN